MNTAYIDTDSGRQSPSSKSIFHCNINNNNNNNDTIHINNSSNSGNSNNITEHQFLRLADEYLLSLSPKKREKALLTNAMYQKILMVLIQPKNTQVSTAQFRFWAKKMFTLSTTATHHVVCHGGKPVATKECLYDVLVYCHRKSSHGGRDKTSAEVRQHYSWVPKELIARFVKHCPLCLSRRGTQQKQSTTGPSSTSALSSSSSSSFPEADDCQSQAKGQTQPARDDNSDPYTMGHNHNDQNPSHLSDIQIQEHWHNAQLCSRRFGHQDLSFSTFQHPLQQQQQQISYYPCIPFTHSTTSSLIQDSLRQETLQTPRVMVHDLQLGTQEWAWNGTGSHQQPQQQFIDEHNGDLKDFQGYEDEGDDEPEVDEKSVSAVQQMVRIRGHQELVSDSGDMELDAGSVSATIHDDNEHASVIVGDAQQGEEDNGEVEEDHDGLENTNIQEYQSHGHQNDAEMDTNDVMASGMVGICHELDIIAATRTSRPTHSRHSYHHHHPYPPRRQNSFHHTHSQSLLYSPHVHTHQSIPHHSIFHQRHTSSLDTKAATMPVTIHPNGHILHSRHPIHNRARIMALAMAAGDQLPMPPLQPINDASSLSQYQGSLPFHYGVHEQQALLYAQHQLFASHDLVQSDPTEDDRQGGNQDGSEGEGEGDAEGNEEGGEEEVELKEDVKEE